MAIQTSATQFKLDSLVIPVSVTLDEVIDYNDENGFTEDDEQFTYKWVGANVTFTINNNDGMGQVQWDSQNKCYSADCDGNVLYSEIKKALLSGFTDEMLADYGFSDDGEKLRDDLEYDILPAIIEFICNFGGKAIDASRA